MVHVSEKKHWDDFWASAPDVKDVYANDDRIKDNLESIVDFEGSRVLEVGAGTGRDGAAIAALGAEVWTLDYSEEALRLMSKTLASPVQIVCGDALALPIAPETFDVVFHQGLLEHFRTPEALLAENHRVLKTGGYILVDVPQRFHYYTFAKHVLMFFDKWFAGWETEFSPKELATMIEEAGFEIVAMYGCNLFPPIWYRGIRRMLLRIGLKIPMYPLNLRSLGKIRAALHNLLPDKFVLNTSMVVGCIGRKR
jgi:ubiquinone/menaquinone biosynthesis C-methylase UbiE